MSRVSPARVATPAAAGERGCALITGASRGIGAASAARLAASGWPVGVNYRVDEDGAMATVAGVREAGGRAIAIPADVSDQDQVEAMFERVEAELGPVLVLVNNAGIACDGFAIGLRDEDWHNVIDTNLLGAFRVMRRALRSMLRARFGRVVNVASLSGIRGVPGQANYSAAKAGLVGMTMSVALEMARRGITVNAIAPGLIDTDMTRAMVNDGVTDYIPIGRAGEVAEVAACVDFLASEGASYVTGAVLPIDGGMSAAATWQP